MAERSDGAVGGVDGSARPTGRFTRRHAWSALFTALPFVLLTLLVTKRPLVALGIVLGPMAGPVARDFQSCCLEFGFLILPWGLGALSLAFSTQWLLPAAGGGRLRLAGWILGLAGWCVSGLVSYLHALE